MQILKQSTSTYTGNNLNAKRYQKKKGRRNETFENLRKLNELLIPNSHIDLKGYAVK